MTYEATIFEPGSLRIDPGFSSPGTIRKRDAVPQSQTSDRPTSTRRAVLLNIGLMSCAAGALVVIAAPGSAAAAASVSQKGASYQPTPKGKQRCDNCGQWAPPAGCKTVEGVIAPAGWCVLYAPK